MAVEDRIQNTIRGTAAGVAENVYGQKPELAREFGKLVRGRATQYDRR